MVSVDFLGFLETVFSDSWMVTRILIHTRVLLVSVHGNRDSLDMRHLEDHGTQKLQTGDIARVAILIVTKLRYL